MSFQAAIRQDQSIALRTSAPAKIVARAPIAPTAAPLRILHVSFSSQFAGSERYCVDLANQQARLGHAVHVVGAPGSPLAANLDKRVTFHGLGRFMRTARLQRLIQAAAIDVAHAHLSPACKALSKVRGAVKKVATLHVGYKARQHQRLDGVICVNRAQTSRVTGFPGEARVISNWLPSASPRTMGTSLRAELALPAGTVLVGGVGRLHPSKGYDVLISAFRATAPENAVLVIAGEGPHRKALERLAAGDPRIRLPGFRKDVAGFLDGLDFFVSPSREESFGLAILEAMRVGLPVVSTATEGPAEHLGDQPIDLVQTGCVAAMSGALARAFAPQSAGRSSRTYDLSKFRQSAGVAKVMDFYRDLIGREDVDLEVLPALSLACA